MISAANCGTGKRKIQDVVSSFFMLFFTKKNIKKQLLLWEQGVIICM